MLTYWASPQMTQFLTKADQYAVLILAHASVGLLPWEGLHVCSGE